MQEFSIIPCWLNLTWQNEANLCSLMIMVTVTSLVLHIEFMGIMVIWLLAAAFTQFNFGLQYCYYAAACIITIALEFRMNCENCLKFWLKQMEFICQNVEVKRFTFLYRHDINCPRIFSIGNHKTVKYVKERILFNSILNQTKCDLDILHLDI